MKRFLVAALLTCVLLALLCGCSCQSRDDSRVFTKGDMSLTLTWDFREEETKGEWQKYYAVYSSEDVIAFVQRIGFEEKPELQDVTGYGYMYALRQQYSDNFGKEAVSVSLDAGIPAFEYTSVQSGKSYKTLCCVLKGSTAVWVMQFSCLEDDYKGLQENMFTWAKSIEM